MCYIIRYKVPENRYIPDNIELYSYISKVILTINVLIYHNNNNNILIESNTYMYLILLYIII